MLNFNIYIYPRNLICIFGMRMFLLLLDVMPLAESKFCGNCFELCTKPLIIGCWSFVYASLRCVCCLSDHINNIYLALATAHTFKTIPGIWWRVQYRVRFLIVLDKNPHQPNIDDPLNDECSACICVCVFDKLIRTRPVYGSGFGIRRRTLVAN